MPIDEVEKLMQTAVEQGVFPGAVLQVVVDGVSIIKNSYGSADLFSRRPMTVDTCFDLASLTKPLATVPAVMALVEGGLLGLDHPISDFCSEIPLGDKAAITTRQLLNHSSGLPAWRPYFMQLRHTPMQQRLGLLRQLLVAERLVSSPASKSEYSDLGYMFLQWIIESVSGKPLDQYATDEIYSPLGIGDLFFCDATQPAGIPHRCAATQLCPWRNQLMVGQVDDDNAYITGGVAGHAGLFGTSDAVCRLLRALLAADHGDTKMSVFDPKLVRTFLNAPNNQRWALGFDTPSSQGSSAGQYFPKRSVGHLGFTGTSFWVHRLKRVIVVLLTNRVHPWRFNPGIKEFRPRLHDAVMNSI